MLLKVLSTDELLKLNESSIKNKRNQNLSDEAYDLLDPEGIHVVENHFIHNDVEIRLILMLKQMDSDGPARALLDVSFEEFDAIRTLDTEEFE
jgi:hypothetical protein